MGQKTISRILQALIITGAINSAHADLQWSESIRTESEPLTTDRVLDLDASILRPHRTRFVIERKMSLSSVSAIRHPKGSGFAVSVHGMENDVHVYFRDSDSPMFNKIENFPCGSAYDDRFATEEQTRFQGQKWAKDWGRKAKKALGSLELSLKTIREPAEAMAVSKARLIADAWYRKLNREWKVEFNDRSPAEEWSAYQAQAQSQGFCKKSVKKTALRSWKEMMDPPAENVKSTQPLARSPARRAGKGDWIIRVNAMAAGTGINGQFVIDPQANQSFISPDWLETQGVEEFLIEDFGKTILRIKRKGRVFLSKSLFLVQPQTSGHFLGISEFGSHEIEDFRPPDDFDRCCDGVLGTDFLLRNVVQFDTSAPLGGILIWPRSDYRAPTGYRWEEVSIEADGTLPGVVAKKIKSNQPLILGLPHGRIWYPSTLDIDVNAKGGSGLKLSYEMSGFTRNLKVISIDPKSPAKVLLKAGLKPGATLWRISDFTVKYLNQWTIDEILRGVWGKKITIEWRDKKDHTKKAVIQLP